MMCELFLAANSQQRKAGFLNETVAQLEISFEFGYTKENQLDGIYEKAESINGMPGNSLSLLKTRRTDDC